MLKYLCFIREAIGSWSIMEPIRLSALGRDVHVGDLYNYFNDDILTGKICVSFKIIV